MGHEESAKWTFSFNGKSKGGQLVAVDTSLFLVSGLFYVGLPRWLSGEESTCQCRRCRRSRLDPWVGRIPWRRKWQSTPVFLPGESDGQRSLVGHSPWACKESDTTKPLTLSLSFFHMSARLGTSNQLNRQRALLCGA